MKYKVLKGGWCYKGKDVEKGDIIEAKVGEPIIKSLIAVKRIKEYTAPKKKKD